MKWPLVSIGELESRGAILKIQDGNHGEKHPKAKDYVNEGVPFIMANDLNNHYLDILNSKKIPQSIAEKLRIGFAKKGDVLLTHKGTLGNTAIVDTDLPYIILTPQVTYYRVNNELLFNKYLMYSFRSPFFQQSMQSVGQQGTRMYIGITAQRNLKIPLADYHAQVKIANILSSYDELILNNKKRIEYLEKFARLLYKEWFVNFRFPGHKKGKIINGIPEGWEVTQYGKIFQFLGGYAFKSKEYTKDGKFGIVTIKNVQKAKFISDCPSRIDNPPKQMNNYCILRSGEILLSLTGNVGRTCIVIGDNYLLNQRVAKIEGNNIPKSFIYWTFNNNDSQIYLENLSHGAAQLNLSPVKLAKEKFVKPTEVLINIFAEFAEPIFQQLLVLNKDNQVLSQTRDLLLPKLMSGEIEV